MAKPNLKEWPWNNRPSSKHQFKVVFQNGSEFGEKCLRCGSHYNTRVGGTAAVYCYPTKEWLADHPSDTMLGPVKTPFG